MTRLSYEEFLGNHLPPQDPFGPLIEKENVVYVFALTRDLCSGCQMQEPLYKKLANFLGKKHGDRVRFYSIHLSNGEGFDSKRQHFRRMLRFAAYPTYLILFKSDAGFVESYRAVEPSMSALEHNIDIAIDLASR